MLHVRYDTFSCSLVLPGNHNPILKLGSYYPEEMRLRGSCYWDYITGKPTANRQSFRIRIPRQQRLTPESLLDLIEKVKIGEW